MTVSTTTNKVSYIGNGVATTFAIPFPFLEQEHLKVRQLLNNVQTERTDWTVSGGNIVFSTAPANDAQIVIMREVPLTQETDYRENEVLPAETLERNFDKLTMQVQQLKERTDRAVTVDIFDDTEATSLIPSIRQSVSDAAEHAGIATQEAQIAANYAQSAANSAGNAATSESKTRAMLDVKANIAADNFSSDGWAVILGKTALNPSASIDYTSYMNNQAGFDMPFTGWMWIRANNHVDISITYVTIGTITYYVNSNSNVAGSGSGTMFFLKQGEHITVMNANSAQNQIILSKPYGVN